MSLSFKGDIRAHRIFNTRFNAPGVHKGSVVMVSLSEIGRSNQAGGLDTPFTGNATMKVYNVSPGEGFVQIRGEIDWDNDLDIQISLFVA